MKDLIEDISAGYYRAALIYAKNRELSLAAEYAGQALRLNKMNENARKLLGICLYESGDLAAAAEVLKDTGLEAFAERALLEERALTARVSGIINTSNRQGGLLSKLFTRKKENINGKTLGQAVRALEDGNHQSVKVLNIKGCMLALAGKYEAAAESFAQVLRRDAGSKLAREALADIHSKGVNHDGGLLSNIGNRTKRRSG